MATSAEVLPLIGVAAGVLLSSGTSALSERARFRRERSARLQDERLAAYAELSASIKESMSVLFRVAAAHGLDPQTEPIALDDARPMLATAFHRREQAFERVLLVGAEDVWPLARAWVRRVYEMRSLVASETTTAEEWQALVRSTNESRSAFHEAARRDIKAQAQPSSRQLPLPGS